MLFIDRVDAGRQLGEKLRGYGGTDVVVVGLPRGGVPVAYEVAAALDAPLDVIVVRKLGIPFQPELAMGAVGEGGVSIVSDWLVHEARVSEQELAAVEKRERDEVERRARQFRRGRPALRSPDGPSSWSMTASPPDRPPMQRARSRERRAPDESSSPPRSAPTMSPTGSARMPMRSSACKPRRSSSQSARATSISPRPRTSEVIDLLDRAAQPGGAAPTAHTVNADPPQRDEDLTVPSVACNSRTPDRAGERPRHRRVRPWQRQLTAQPTQQATSPLP